jgi:hypothetical protein
MWNCLEICLLLADCVNAALDQSVFIREMLLPAVCFGGSENIFGENKAKYYD